jgi:hypothetical protein
MGSQNIRSLEDGNFVLNMVHLERTECKEL